MLPWQPLSLFWCRILNQLWARFQEFIKFANRIALIKRAFQWAIKTKRLVMCIIMAVLFYLYQFQNQEKNRGSAYPWVQLIHDNLEFQTAKNHILLRVLCLKWMISNFFKYWKQDSKFWFFKHCLLVNCSEQYVSEILNHKNAIIY